MREVDVVGVVTLLVCGGAQVVLHGDQVVELSVLLGVHEQGEVEKDGEGQVEVEREEGEVKEKRKEKLILGVDVFDLDLGVKINPIKQPNKSNSMSSGNMSHCWTPAFHNHFDHSLIVLKHIQ